MHELQRDNVNHAAIRLGGLQGSLTSQRRTSWAHAEALMHKYL